MCVADESSVVAFMESMAVEMMMSPLGRSPPPPFIDTRRGGYMQGRSQKSSSSPRIGEVQWSAIVESTLWSTGEHDAGRGSHPEKLFSLAGIAPARDGNGYEISAYPRIPNPTGTNMGLSLCPRARARVQL